jgi:hypothetical protein
LTGFEKGGFEMEQVETGDLGWGKTFKSVEKQRKITYDIPISPYM